MTNFSHGREAEAAAAQFLIQNGYKILSQNWRTRHCEIDIVAIKKRTIYFIEVKYRQNAAQGSGLEYVTPKKLKQMELAARFWAADNNFRGNYQLSAIEVSGPKYDVTEFIENCG